MRKGAAEMSLLLFEGVLDTGGARNEKADRKFRSAFCVLVPEGLLLQDDHAAYLAGSAGMCSDRMGLYAIEVDPARHGGGPCHR